MVFTSLILRPQGNRQKWPSTYHFHNELTHEFMRFSQPSLLYVVQSKMVVLLQVFVVKILLNPCTLSRKH